MTRFYFNEREIYPSPGMISLDKILSHIDEEELPPNSVVRMISIDGNPLLNEDLTEISEDINQQIFNGEKVEIISGTVDEIIHDSLSEAFEYLERLREGIPRLALNFQTDPGRESFEYLSQLYEGFYWLNLLLNKLTAKFNADFNCIQINELSIKEHQRIYITILKQLLDAQKKRDMVLISDLLENEIAPMVPVWKEMFQVISRRTGQTQ